MEQQKISFGIANPTGGSWTLAFSNGSSTQTTSAIGYLATAQDVQNALSALSNIGPGNVVVNGSMAAGFTVTYVGRAGQPGLPDARPGGQHHHPDQHDDLQ